MNSQEAGAAGAGLRVLPAWFAGERPIWLAIACLLAALLLVRAGFAPERGLLLANPLGLVLFAMFYILIRVRESGGRL